jgi:hypothetical protein
MPNMNCEADYFATTFGLMELRNYWAAYLATIPDCDDCVENQLDRFVGKSIAHDVLLTE